jgi:peptide/nickel transport system substrate-binding protein
LRFDLVSRRWPHRPVAAAILAAATLLLAGCPAERRDVPADGEPRTGGTVVVGMRTDFAGLNSITNTAIYTDELIKYGLFTPLVSYDEQLEVQPRLAESWQLEGDTAVVFRLRQDVRWYDGEPVAAEDVKFTFDRAKDPAAASLLGSAYLPEVRSAEVLDPYTIRFDFERPHAQALEDFWWAPMPRHLLEHVPPAELRNAPFNRQPVGNGPFRFVEWRANERLVMERNPEYPEGLGGPPRVDRVVFRIIPEVATMQAELLTGRADMALPVEADQAAQVAAAPDLELSAFPGRTFFYIGWNNARPPFDRPEVRRAMTHAINRQDIIDALLFGFAEPATNTVPPWHPYSPRDLEPLPYDPDRAAALLDAAGWRDRTGDGIREDEAGRRLSFDLLSSDRQLTRSVAEVVQSHLRRVGVDMRVRVVEFQTLLAQHRAREFDAVLSAWVLDNFQLASTPMALFHSRWVDVPQSTNRSSFADPRADALIERAAVATDPAEARAVWRDFTLLLQELQPFTFMFWQEEISGVNQRLGGVVQDPRGQLLTMQHWWIAGGVAN